MELRHMILFRIVAAIKRSVQVMTTLLYGQGLFMSMLRDKPIGRNGEWIPWFTYPAIEYLKQFDVSDKRVFEYGSGNSSIFWARRAREVVAVESDSQWYRYVSSIRPPNLVLLLETEKEGYVSSICLQDGKFEVIVIDGKWRHACVDVCTHYLNEGGMIILDNSDRYAEACRQIRNNGFFQIDFNGFGPINGYTWTTSIFIRGATEMQEKYSASSPLGGLEQVATDED